MIFMAPELIDSARPQDVSGFEQKSSWDVAVRFQDLKRLGNIPEKEKMLLKRRAIEGVLRHAQEVLGSILKPEKTVTLGYQDFLTSGARGDLDVLATLEETLGERRWGSDPMALRFEARLEKTANIALMMDTSLSMTGEKLALLAVSAAVVALCVPSSQLSLMGFDSKARWVKRFGQGLAIDKIVERILELPAGGFTNLELALEEQASSLQREFKSRASVILISDGKYTEGGDPSRLAPLFTHLNVLKIGRDQAGRELLLELSSSGNGLFFEARKPFDLPKAMYGAMKALLR